VENRGEKIDERTGSLLSEMLNSCKKNLLGSKFEGNPNKPNTVDRHFSLNLQSVVS
jgi:hypothetical protein